ncbi:MAG: amidohydrolase family protein [Firmicutes bacterium]|nr:amidohydrolase family protein [Bacillota bacterium]
MAFGFFKKVETADLILHNGHIFTQDPELPWASAVACKGETVMGVGSFENMDSIIGKDTKIVDLDGKYLFPGFIDIHRSPVLNVFKEKYADLSQCFTTEEVLEAVSEWAEENPDADIIFGYGYRDDLKPGSIFETEEEAEAGEEFEEVDGERFVKSAVLLSEACSDRPVVLLAANCVDCWTNTVADKIIVETAEEEMVSTITVNYVLNLFIPFDFEEVEIDVRQQLGELADQGFTSVLNIQAPDYFENLYQDSIIGLYNEGEMRQRFFGSFFVNRPLMPQAVVHRLMTRKTTCLELGNMIHADVLNISIDNDNSPIPFTQEALDTILMDVSDRGFNVYVEANNRSDMMMAYAGLENIRSKGYKNTFVIACDHEPFKEDVENYMYWESAFKTWANEPFAAASLSGSNMTTAEAIDHLTTDAAKVIGMEDYLGAIESGKLADFTVFDENLLELEPAMLLKAHAVMTVLGGEIVYDAEAENDMEMYTLMAGQHL